MAGLRERETIAGRYELERMVRTGGISVVYRAVDLETKKPVAVKVINIHGAEEALRRRIDRETDILTRLSHPHIVGCHDAGQLGEARMFIVLDWLEGEDLSDFMARAPLSLRQVLMIVEQVADALDLAHEHDIIHRDIKPANIFLMHPEVGAPPDTRVLDFGVAKMPESSSSLTRAGAILGTPSYMAPEQANHAMRVDGRADIFSLGVVAYEALTGGLPWKSGTDLARLAHILIERATPVREVAANVPAGVADLIDAMLDPELDERIGTAGAVKAIARGCLDALPSSELDVVFVESGVGQLVRADTVDLDTPPEEEVGRTRLLDALSLDALAGGTAEVSDSMLEFVDPSEATISALEAETGSAELPLVPVGPSGFEQALDDDSLSHVDHVPDAMIFGRLSEADRLRSRALTPQATARPSYTLVVGAAGVGKTRLRTELSRLLRQTPSPPRIFAGRAEEIMQNTPYAYLRKVLFAAAKILPRDDMSTRRRKLTELVPTAKRLESMLEIGSAHSDLADTTIPPTGAGQTLFFTGEELQGRQGDANDTLDAETERATIAAFTCEALGVEYPAIPPLTAARADARLLREQLHRALSLVMRSVALPDGFVILIDDAHLLDHQSAELFAALLNPELEIPFATIAFALPHFIDVDARHHSALAEVDLMMAEIIELLPLEPRPSRELVRNILRGDIDAGALEVLVNRAKGNPLYLEQLVRAVLATGVLAPTDAQEYVLVPPDDDDAGTEPIPPTVAAAVSARISKLRPSAQRVLTVAAVFGEVFWTEGVAALLGAPVEDVAHEVDRLISKNFFRRRQMSRYPDTSEIEFTHAVIRSVAMSRLKRPRRKSLEQQVVDYLQAVGEPDAAVLASHLGQSGQPIVAAKMFRSAALASLERGDAPSAGSLAEDGLRGLEGVDDISVRRELLDVAEQVAIVNGDWEAGRDALDQMADLDVGAEAQARLLLRRSRLAHLSKRYEEAVIEADGAKQSFIVLNEPAGVAEAELCRAEASEALGDERAALRSYLAAQSQYGPPRPESEGAPARSTSRVSREEQYGMARIGRGLAHIAVASGDYRAAENRFRGAFVHVSALRDHELLFRTNLGLADVSRLLGESMRAREFLQEALRVAFDDERRLLVRVYQAEILAEERRLEDAFDRLERIYARAEDVRSLGSVRRLSALRRGQLLRMRPGGTEHVRPTARRLASVQAHLERALGSAATEQPALTIALKLALGVVLALRGDDARAKSLTAEALARFDTEGAVLGDEPPWIFYGHARVLQLTGAPVRELARAMKNAVTHLDSITGRLDRRDRQRYLDRWVARSIVMEAKRVGLSLTQSGSSSRLVIKE